MAPITQEEHIRLLFACIKNSKGPGQVDWSGVAKDTELTSNAATKRYNKLAKDYGLSDLLRSSRSGAAGSRTKNTPAHEEGAQDDTQEDPPREKGKRGPTRLKERASKKRKMKEESEDDGSRGKEVDYEVKDEATA